MTRTGLKHKLPGYLAFENESAWYVPYTGGLRSGGAIDCQPKHWGNARHSVRCVRDALGDWHPED